MQSQIIKILFVAFILATLEPRANAEPVKKNMPACTSESLLDELISYYVKDDKEGIRQLYMTGNCIRLQTGESVSVVSQGFMVTTIRYKGVKLFTPAEALR